MDSDRQCSKEWLQEIRQQSQERGLSLISICSYEFVKDHHTHPAVPAMCRGVVNVTLDISGV